MDRPQTASSVDWLEVHGVADDGFGPVADAFLANLRDRNEVGAAVALYVDGRKVVDLWGGLADRRTGRPWTENTPALFFSVTKGVLAVCIYLLVQRRQIELDARVTRYWPEYGRNGKADTTVRMLLSHQAGLPALDRPFTLAEVLAWDPVIRAIEHQAPLWPPGTAHSYHPITYGWLVGEVIQRVTGMSPGTFLRDAIADPMGLQVWIGAPESVIRDAAWLEPPLPDLDPAATAAAVAASQTFVEVIERAVTMGGAFGFPVSNGLVSFNDPRIQSAEIPGANGIGTAESVARLYAACVSEVGGPQMLTRASLDDALRTRSSGKAVFAPADDGHRWGTGFLLDSPPGRPMLGDRSFGHDGAGGQLAFGDEALRVGFAYVNNQMGGNPDERANVSISAVRSCVRG